MAFFGVRMVHVRCFSGKEGGGGWREGGIIDDLETNEIGSAEVIMIFVGGELCLFRGRSVPSRKGPWFDGGVVLHQQIK